MAEVNPKKQAEQILKAYAEDIEGLTLEECVATGFTQPQSEVLVEVLGKGVRGKVTAEEQAALEKAGFVSEFIDELMGVDGKAALQRRVQFFEPVVQKNIALLSDSDGLVRDTAAKTLGEIGAPQAVSSLIAALSDVYTQYNAIQALGEIGHPRVIAILIDAALNAPDQFVRNVAIVALEKIGDSSAIPPLIDVLRHPAQRGVQDNAEAALRQIVNQQTMPTLLALLGDPYWYMRHKGARILGYVGGPDEVPALEVLKSDSNENVRETAVLALGIMGGDLAVQALVATLKESNQDTRKTAVQALGLVLYWLGPADLVPYLRDLDQMVEGNDPGCDADCQIYAGQVLDQLNERFR